MTNLFKDIDPHIYDIDVSPTMFTEKEARAEYVRLAKIANQRIQRIRESKDFGDSAAAQRDYFVQTVAGAKAEFRTERQLRAALQSVAHFTQRQSSTLTGLRKMELRQLETMRGMGYKFLNRDNIHEFRKFWQEVKKHADASKYDSESVVELYRVARNKRVDPISVAEDFEFWRTRQKELDTMKRSNSKINSDEAKERLSL